MGKRVGILLLSVMIVCLASESWAQTDIIESTATYPDYATDGDSFTACMLIKQATPCKTGTLETAYSYTNTQDGSYYTGFLFPIREYIRKYHFLIDESPQDRIWCAKINAIDFYNSLGFYAVCRDELDNYHEDNQFSSIDVGNIIIGITSEFDEQRLFAKHVGDDIEISAYLDDYTDSHLSYSVYNISLGAPVIENKVLSKIEGQYVGSFEIPSYAPTGFIQIISDDYPYGGKFISYAALPYDAEITILNDTYMGSTVDFELDIENDYGKIRNIESYVVLPNKTEQRIYLDHINTSTEYIIPLKPGNYTIECRINHSMLENGITKKYFIVPEYQVDINRGRAAYYQGDKINLEIGLLNSFNEPVKFDPVIRVLEPDGGSSTYDADDTEEEDNYHKLSFELDDDADLGTYEITVVAEDESGNEYTGNESFVVNEKDTSIVFASEPVNISVDINTMTTTRVPVTLYNVGDDDIEDIEISLEDEELGDYVMIDTSEFNETIEVDESSSFEIVIMPDEDLEEELYETYINVVSDDITYQIPFTMNVSFMPNLEYNESISMTIITGKAASLSVQVINSGAKAAEGITLNIAGDIEPYSEYVSNADSIEAGSTTKFTIVINEITTKGIYEGYIYIATENAGTVKVDVIIEVLEDFKKDIDTIIEKKQVIDALYDKLKDKGTLSDNVKEDLDDLQDVIDQMSDYYNKGEYSKSYSLLTKIENEASNIEEILAKYDIVETEPEDYCGDGICGDTENDFNCPEDCSDTYEEEDNTCNFDGKCQTSTEDCYCDDCQDDDMCAESSDSGGGSSTMIIIFVVVILVVIVVIVATSIVPDNAEQQYGKK